MDFSQPFLQPIEHPKGITMKVAYLLTRQKFGKVITPLKVVSARLPAAFGKFGARIFQLDKKLILPRQLVLLIRQRVSQINVCSFCMDAGRATAVKELFGEAKFDMLYDYNKSSLFSDAEKAALDYVTELTKYKKVNAQTFTCMAKYYSEREICEIVYLVASEHFTNLTNIGLNIHSDMLCNTASRKKYK